jgi:hypothetical protein
MVNTLTEMYNLKGNQIDFTQAFPQAKLKEDISNFLQDRTKNQRMGPKTQKKPIWTSTITKKLVS